MRLVSGGVEDKEESRMSEDIIRTFEEKMVSSVLLEIPRNTLVQIIC